MKIRGPGPEATKDWTFNFSESAHFPLIIARPRAVTVYVVPERRLETQDTVKTGRPIVSSAGTAPVPVAALNGPALATPIFSGNLME